MHIIPGGKQRCNLVFKFILARATQAIDRASDTTYKVPEHINLARVFYNVVIILRRFILILCCFLNRMFIYFVFLLFIRSKTQIHIHRLLSSFPQSVERYHKTSDIFYRGKKASVLHCLSIALKWKKAKTASSPFLLFTHRVCRKIRTFRYLL